MSELGNRLREARVNKGYTLNTLQQMTKIQKKYLQAIEEGRMDELPGNFYARAFVKQYADMVGLDGDVLLREYESEIDIQNKEEQPAVSQEEELPSRFQARHLQNENNKLEKLLSYVPMIILSAILIFIVIILMLAIRQITSENKANNSTSQPSTSVVESVQPSTVSEELEQPRNTEETISNRTLAENQVQVGKEVMTQLSEAGQLKTYQLEGPIQNYSFQAEGNAFVWVGIYEDDVMVLDQTIKAGESIDFTAKKATQTLRMELGYPEGASFKVNGTKVEPDPSVPNTLLFQVKEEGANQEPESLTLESTTTTGFQGPAVLDPSNSSGE